MWETCLLHGVEILNNLYIVLINTLFTQPVLLLGK